MFKNTVVTIVERGKTSTPKQLTLDKVNGYIYWSSRNGGLVQRSKLDGSNVETILVLETYAAPVGCVIDEENGVLYWSEKNYNRIGIAYYALVDYVKQLYYNYTIKMFIFNDLIRFAWKAFLYFSSRSSLRC